MYSQQFVARPDHNFLDTDMPLFNKSQLTTILNTNADHEDASVFLEPIKTRMTQEILRCVNDCPEAHLARLACGTQPLGVAFDTNLRDFKIIFTEGWENGLADPWYHRALDKMLLPTVPPLGESGRGSAPVAIASKIAGISRRQRERLTDLVKFDEHPHENELELLMLNPRVTEGVRALVLDGINCKYAAQLTDCPAEIYDAWQGCISDQVWENEHRAAAAAKEKATKATAA